MKKLLIVAALLLTGCAGMSKSMQYNDVNHVVFSDPSLPHAFWIFDKPAESRMLLTPGLGATMQQAAVAGATFGLAASFTHPQQKFEMAAQIFLASSGRSCAVTRVDLVLAPTNYEAFYTCNQAAVVPRHDQTNAPSLPK